MGNTSIGMQVFSSALRASTYKHSNRHKPPLRVKVICNLGFNCVGWHLYGIIFTMIKIKLT